MAAYVLKSGADKSTLFLLLGIVSVVGSLVFLCLRVPTKLPANDAQGSELLNPSVALSRDSKAVNDGPLQEIKDTFYLMISRRML